MEIQEKERRTNHYERENKVQLMTMHAAKGLEFDHVILPNADPENYPEGTLSRHRLYTAISRATQNITILAKKELSPLLG